MQRVITVTTEDGTKVSLPNKPKKFVADQMGAGGPMQVAVEWEIGGGDEDARRTRKKAAKGDGGTDEPSEGAAPDQVWPGTAKVTVTMDNQGPVPPETPTPTPTPTPEPQKADAEDAEAEGDGGKTPTPTPTPEGGTLFEGVVVGVIQDENTFGVMAVAEANAGDGGGDCQKPGEDGDGGDGGDGGDEKPQPAPEPEPGDEPRGDDKTK